MRRIPENVIDNVRQKSDIVDTISTYLTLSKRGKNYWGVCPFHDDHDPSMSVSPDKQIYKCFVCGAGGNVFTFIQNFDGVNFTDAVIKQASKVNVDLEEYRVSASPIDEKKNRLYELMDSVKSFTQYTLSSRDGKAAMNILHNRGYSEALLKYFAIGVALDNNKIQTFLHAKGYTYDEMLTVDIVRADETSTNDVFYNRIMFPIHDQYGRTIAFSARTLDPNGTVKYINTSQTPLYVKSEHLYNFHNAKESGRKSGNLILCEGVTDTMAFHEGGYPNSVALLGVNCSDTQMRLLRSVSNSTILAFDGDKAGLEATYNIGSKLLENGFKVSVWYNDTGLDPDEVIKKYGVKRIVEGFEHPIGWYDFVLNYAFGLYGNASFEDKKRVIALVTTHLSKADALTRSYYVKILAERTGFQESVLLHSMQEVTQKNDTYPVNDVQYFDVKSKAACSKPEREILRQMLLSKEGALLFRDKLGFLPSPLAHQLSLLLLDAYRTHDVIEVADLYSMNLSEELQSFISDIFEYEGVNSFRSQIIRENIDRIQAQIVRKNLKSIRNDIENKSFSEQLELLKEATASKRKEKGGNENE